jgi:hypothetical protein
MALQHLRSSTADKRPNPTAMSEGQLALNSNLASPGLFFKDSNGDLVKAGPVHVGTTAPNVSPASGGQAGNSKGELWLDTTGSDYTLKTWDGSAWREIVVTSAMIKDGAIVNADINASAAIALSKLATGALPTGITVASTNIVDGTILNADINASAAIAGTKVSPDFGSQNVVTTGTATAASLIPTGSVAPANGVYLPATNAVALTTNSTDRLYIDSSGNIGAGTTVPSTLGGGGQLVLQKTGGSRLVIASNSRRFYITGASGSDDLRIGRRITSDTVDSDILTVDGSGRVGIGTTAPQSPLHVVGSSVTLEPANPGNVLIKPTKAGGAILIRQDENTTDRYLALGQVDNLGAFNEFSRLDNSGRLLVGTSSARSNLFNTSSITSNIFQVEKAADSAGISIVTNNDTSGTAYLALCRSKGTAIGSNTLVASGDVLGTLTFQGNDGTEFVDGARIEAYVDGTSGANDLPTRLVFSTTADGASSPTERMRINNDGSIVGGGNTSSSNLSANTGFALYRNSSGNFNGLSLSKNATDWGTAVYIHRTFGAGDGTLIEFAHDTVTEGVISVSGTTVTYGGGHLARWSQLPNDEDPSGLLKGTVMSNLDEMCEWGEEDNEQLNKTKISDVEGDPNVAGVFVSTSFSDDGLLDYFCAMTGDMIIRIAEGVTVQRGDLLMSAGDGTAKPQDDDIIRSKTVAKVTSTHVTCTYDDGSYCVPCVLMAC